MRTLRRFITVSFTLLAVLASAAIAAVIILNKPLPTGEQGAAAEALADSILAAIPLEAWNRMRYVAWTHKGRTQYVWDKLYNLVELRYGDMRVLLNLNTIDGIVWKNRVRLSGDAKRRDIDAAWKSWCNDAFWLTAHTKLRDPGTVRKRVRQQDGSYALLVTYTQGGITPGDSYLWILDDAYRPVAWRMWVRMLPVKGIEATWEGWTQLEGAWCPSLHCIGPYRIAMQDLRSGRHHSELGFTTDPFADFVPLQE